MSSFSRKEITECVRGEHKSNWIKGRLQIADCPEMKAEEVTRLLSFGSNFPCGRLVGASKLFYREATVEKIGRKFHIEGTKLKYTGHKNPFWSGPNTSTKTIVTCSWEKALFLLTGKQKEKIC